MRRLTASGLVLLAVIVVTLSERRVYSHKPITTNIIFKKEIAQIFQRTCFQCHSENNLAMSLTTYAQARPWARAIREEVLDRKMPPWGAVTGFGHFSNDVSLTQREIDIILSWADGGAPSGVLKVEETIPPVYVPPLPQWDAGEPDEVIAAGAVTIEGGSGNRVERLEVRGAFGEPRALKALAFRPGDRRVVRYAAVYEAATRRWLYTWTPWYTAMTLPDGVAYRVPARARFTLEIGYRAAEEAVTDTSELGVYFDAARSSQDAAPMVVGAPALELKPGAPMQRVRLETVVSDNRRALAIWPEARDGLQSLEVSTAAPDGVVEPLLWVKNFRADWPTSYVFTAPAALPRGTRVLVTAYYENTSDKPVSVKPVVSIVTSPAFAPVRSGRASAGRPEARGRSASREGRNVKSKRDR